jgi:hypothetical protein
MTKADNKPDRAKLKIAEGRKKVAPPPKKVGDQTPNPLPDGDESRGGDPGRTS